MTETSGLGVRGRLGARGERWGHNGCDWLAMRLEFAFGASAARIAAGHDVSADTVKTRARAEGWRRDHSDEELLAMMCSVQLARVHEALRAGSDGKVASRSKSLRSLQLAREQERMMARMGEAIAREEAAKADSGEQDTDCTEGDNNAEPADRPSAYGSLAELRDRICRGFERRGIKFDDAGRAYWAAGAAPEERSFAWRDSVQMAGASGAMAAGG